MDQLRTSKLNVREDIQKIEEIIEKDIKEGLMESSRNSGRRNSVPSETNSRLLSC